MRILFVAMAQSVHVARWIGQLSDTGWDLHLFPSMWPSEIHPDLKDVTIHGCGLVPPKVVPQRATIADTWPLRRGGFVIESFICQHLPALRDRARMLAKTIQKIQPDIVHSIEMQHAGYLTDESLGRFRGCFPQWAYSCWGNDIYYFGRLKEHESRIRSVLNHCDYFTADCHRDSRLVREWGFKGTDLGYFPGPGGFHLKAMRSLRATGPVAARRAIAVKGYDHWGGRALKVLEAVHRCCDVLKNYEIVVYSAPPHVCSVVHHIAAVTDLNISVLPTSPHSELMKLMGRSRVSVGNSVTDGTPNSMLEAMTLGALPIQSDTVSTAEWINQGQNGFLVEPENVGSIEKAIRAAIEDDMLVEHAAELNLEIVKRRIAWSVVQPRVIAMYERVIRDQIGGG